MSPPPDLPHASTHLSAGHVLVPLAGLACLLPWVNPAMALVGGVALAVLVGNPYAALTRKHTPRLLSYSVVGLGAAMNLGVVARVGAQGFVYTLVGITATLALGLVLARLLKVPGTTGLLISVGTAICGGSAIAAVVPVVQAREQEASVALGTVFLLNAAALVVFPAVGHALGLGEGAFGLWSALAIHDTSSVVGASLRYGGTHTLEVATTVKLARALWIIPVTLAVGAVHARLHGAAGQGKAKRPWFILGFLAAAALVTFVPALQGPGHAVASVARRALVVTLFLIGVNLTPAALRAVGVRPLLQGVVLWVVVSAATLGAILAGWVQG